jgi:YfiH family protein
MHWRPEIRSEIFTYPFFLDFGVSKAQAAFFPFIFEGKPVTEAGSLPAPSCLVSGRSAGNMEFNPAEEGNAGSVREAFFRSLGIRREAVYNLKQIHSRDVFVVEGLPAAFIRQGDGMVSFRREVFPAVTVADCLPVFLLDTESGSFAVFHSGWKGTGIVLHGLAIMKEAGTRPEAVAAVLGPCIQSCCYVVDDMRSEVFENEFGENSNLVPPGTPYPLGQVTLRNARGVCLALQAANARLLAGAGVRHIAYCTDCTFTDERLGSFRREGRSFTRMIAMAGYF